MDFKDPERLVRNMGFGMAITAAIMLPVVLVLGMFFSCMLCGACGSISRRPGAPPPARPIPDDTREQP